VPVLELLRGPLGIVLLAGGAVLALSALLPPVPVPRPSGRVLFAAAALFFLVLGLHYSSRLRVSGDEPHYLLMARSLWQEGDLDLRDNFAREEFRDDTPGPVAPHYGAPRKDGRPYPAHSPGLAVLLAPLYGAFGRRACVAALALAAAALTVQAHALAERMSGNPRDALVAWAACLGPPVAFYAFHVYTEVPAALALAAALRILLGTPAAPAAAGAALLASTLPWLHIKMIPAAAVLGIVGMVRLRGTARAAFAAVAALAAVAFLAYYQLVFGTPSPLAIYGGLPAGEGGAPVRAAAGLLLDRSFGLLPHGPVFLLALAGTACLRPREHWPHVLVGLAVVLPVLGWRMWWGGQCPPGRFLVPAVPLLAVALAARLGRGERGLARWRWPLAAAGLALLLFAVWDPGALRLLNRGDRPTRVWSDLSSDRDAGRYLPSLVFADAEETRVAVVWGVALALLLALDRAALKRDRVDRLFKGPGLAVGLVLLVGVTIDYWARSP
jgi:hypothetical protein